MILHNQEEHSNRQKLLFQRSIRMKRALQHTTVIISLLFAAGLMMVPFHQHEDAHSEHPTETGQSIHPDSGSDICFLCLLPIHLEAAQTQHSTTHLQPSDRTPCLAETSSNSPCILHQQSRAPPVISPLSYTRFYSG